MCVMADGRRLVRFVAGAVLCVLTTFRGGQVLRCSEVGLRRLAFAAVPAGNGALLWILGAAGRRELCTSREGMNKRLS